MDDTTLSIMIKLGMQEEENAKVTLAKLEHNFNLLQKAADKLRTSIQTALDHDEDVGLLKAQLEDVEAQISDTTVMAAKLNREMKQAQWDNLKKIGGDLEQVGDKIANIGRGMSIMGVGILAGVYSSIQKFNADNPLDLTAQRWLAAQDDIESSFSRIGGVAADRLLPLIEKLADLAEKTADFVEKNPEMIDALVGLGSFMAVAGGGLQLAGGAMKLGGGAMNMAAKAGEAGLFAEGGALASGGAVASGAATAGSAALLIAAPIVGAMFAKEVGNAFQRSMGQGESSWGDIATTAKQIGSLIRPISLLSFALDGLGFDEASAKTRNLSNELSGLGTATEDAAEAEAIAAAQKKANAEDEAAATKLMANLTQENAKAERKFAADREAIFSDEARAMEDANRKLADKLSDISSALASNIRKIDANLKTTLADISETLKTSLAELGENFANENIQAEREYQQQRADIVSSGADEIKKINQKKQKDLADAERDHAKNTKSLIADRDALGLVQENNAYAEKQAEIKRNAEESTVQARANTKAQLAEAARNYEEQRAQRFAEYQKQKEEANAKAISDKAEAQEKAATEKAEAQQKAAEEKAKANKDAAEQKAEIERKRVEALTDLKKAYDRERSERITAVYNEITELKGAMNAEMLMRRQYNNQILADTTAHMKSMQAAQSQTAQSQSTGGKKGTGVAILTKSSDDDPPHDYSGYAYTGTYAMAQDGQREFVLSGAATKAAEQMVGGQLNQQALLSGLAGQGGTGMQYTDQASYSGVTVADMRRIRQMSRQEAIAVMSEVQRK